MAERLGYGSWPSPISAHDLVQGVAALGEVICDGADVWFSEARPEEGGRVALMRWRAGEIVEMTPPDANVRTRVHEYGGGAWWVADGTLWFVDDSDQRLRRMDDGGPVDLLTEAPPSPRSVRYADGRSTPDKEWFVCVRETHRDDSEPLNELVAIPGDGEGPVGVVASGADFYSSPRLSPDGSRLAWIQWDHPSMPWDSTELWVGQRRDGALVDAERIAGAAGGEAIVLPGFTAAGDLLAVSDRDEWWNLYRFDGSAEPQPVVTGAFEIATPGWVFGLSRWVEHDAAIVSATTDPGGDTIRSQATGEVRADWSAVTSLSAGAGGVAFVGAHHDRDPALVRWVPGNEPEMLRPPRALGIEGGFLTAPDHIVFPTTEGEEAHGWFYAPSNPEYEAPEGERPPLLVLAHGGPTARARTELSLGLRYWTSRGFAVVDVDYRGSTGYGRTYRRALDGRWGIADVDDCIAAAHHLIDRGSVDADRVLIRGGSAGGLTVLGALIGSDVFAAGASRYGVADLTALVRDTHKFEARYCDRLVAPWPEGAEVYEARSPINHTEELSTPMIVLQGDADAVVPPSQAEALIDALARRGVPHTYLLFEGVGHGFRDAETIVTALEAELSFFCQVLGIEPAGDIEPIPVTGTL